MSRESEADNFKYLGCYTCFYKHGTFQIQLRPCLFFSQIQLSFMLSPCLFFSQIQLSHAYFLYFQIQVFQRSIGIFHVLGPKLIQNMIKNCFFIKKTHTSGYFFSSLIKRHVVLSFEVLNVSKKTSKNYKYLKKNDKKQRQVACLLQYHVSIRRRGNVLQVS